MQELAKQLTPELASLISPRSHMHLLKNLDHMTLGEARDDLHGNGDNRVEIELNMNGNNNHHGADPDDTLVVPELPLDTLSTT